MKPLLRRLFFWDAPAHGAFFGLLRNIINKAQCRFGMSIIAFTMLFLLSGCEKADFYNYTGYRDWWRFPLKYPYQMLIIDTFDVGTFEKYNGGDIRDPNNSSEGIITVSALIQQDDRVIFRLPEDEFYGNGYLYAVFYYDSGQLLQFKDEASLKLELKTDVPLKFQSLEEALRNCDFKRPPDAAKRH